MKVYKGAHHAWEALTPKPHFDPKAQNFRNCRGTIDDRGISTTSDGLPIPRNGVHQHQVGTCMTLGAHCCGGTPTLKTEGARDLVTFFRRSGL